MTLVIEPMASSTKRMSQFQAKRSSRIVSHDKRQGEDVREDGRSVAVPCFPCLAERLS